jgi:hypothetical protein
MAAVHVFAIPNTLYRYRSLADLEREIGTIEQNYIYCGGYAALNDPMEGFFGQDGAFARTREGRRIKRAIDAVTPNIGIGSFCEAHDNELMWAHYADQFRGICIAYDFRRLIAELADDVYFARMNYAERLPIVGLSRREPEILAMRVLSYKNHRWGYEREWRMFAPTVGAIHYKSRKAIRRVHLGHRVGQPAGRRLRARLAALGIAATTMSLDGYAIRL